MNDKQLSPEQLAEQAQLPPQQQDQGSNIVGNLAMILPTDSLIVETAAAAKDLAVDAASAVADKASDAVSALGDAASSVAETAGDVAEAVGSFIGDLFS